MTLHRFSMEEADVVSYNTSMMPGEITHRKMKEGESMIICQIYWYTSYTIIVHRCMCMFVKYILVSQICVHLHNCICNYISIQRGKYCIPMVWRIWSPFSIGATFWNGGVCSVMLVLVLLCFWQFGKVSCFLTKECLCQICSMANCVASVWRVACALESVVRFVRVPYSSSWDPDTSKWCFV